MSLGLGPDFSQDDVVSRSSPNYFFQIRSRAKLLWVRIFGEPAFHSQQWVGNSACPSRHQRDQWVDPPAWLLPSDPVLDIPFLCLYHRGLTLRVPASLQLPAASWGHWLKTGGPRGRSSWGIPPPSSPPWAAMVSLAAAALLIDEPSVILSSSSDSSWLWGHDFFLPSF